MTKWVIVANSERCRIFEQEADSVFCEKEDWVHPASRLHDRQSMSDRPGSDHGGVGQGRHPMPPKTDPHVHEKEVFADQICEQLAHWHDQGGFDRLILVAPPAFLGRLRHAMNDELRKLVVGEVNKDLTTCSVDEVQEHIKKMG